MFKIRCKCIENENWHYIYAEQVVVDPNINCSEHPESVIEDFVIVQNEA